MVFDAPGPFDISWGDFVLIVAAGVGGLGLAYAAYLGRERLRGGHLVLVLVALLLPVFGYLASIRDVTVSDGPDNPRPVCLFGYEEPKAINWGDDCGQALRERLVLAIAPSAVVLLLLVGGVTVTARRRGATCDQADV